MSEDVLSNSWHWLSDYTYLYCVKVTLCRPRYRSSFRELCSQSAFLSPFSSPTLWSFSGTSEKSSGHFFFLMFHCGSWSLDRRNDYIIFLRLTLCISIHHCAATATLFPLKTCTMYVFKYTFWSWCALYRKLWMMAKLEISCKTNCRIYTFDISGDGPPSLPATGLPPTAPTLWTFDVVLQTEVEYPADPCHKRTKSICLLFFLLWESR